MNVDIDTIKRKLLIKYPVFGSIIANLEFKEDKGIDTAGTDGKVVLYNSDFVNNLSDAEKTFLFAHEVGHVAFDHILRSEGKDKQIWNMSADAVLNALLKQDGMPLIKGGVDIPEAINYDVEEMYNKLLEEKKKQEEQTGNQQSEQSSQGQKNSQGNQEQQESNAVGHDTHELWEKAIEERKKELKEQENSEGSQGKEEKEQQNSEKQDNKSKVDKEEENKSKDSRANEKDKQKLKNEFIEKGEPEIFKKNKEEKKRQLEELSKQLVEQSSKQAGTGIQREGRQLSDIGIAAPLIDWRKHLRQAIKYNEDWTRKNARMKNGYFRHRVEQLPMPETEILLDTSGSVSETLLKNFLRECKNIVSNSKVRVGCFNTEFHGFTELRRVEDIDNLKFRIGGGTDFNPAVEAFSRRVPNKIIFTDGDAPMPRKLVNNIIWVVFGDAEINPKGGKVINITDEQLERLYKSRIDFQERDQWDT